jgi:hypothetical protein
MPPFLLFGSFLHLTITIVVAYFVLFTASRSDGRLRTAGNWLGIWLLFYGLADFALGVAGPPLHSARPICLPAEYPINNCVRPPLLIPPQR